jgi:protein-S-isoprenylcysteine O-methyltransferase Ste14
MKKKAKRWPIWKIAVSATAFLAVSPLLFWLSGLVEEAIDKETADPARGTQIVTFSSLITMLGMVAAMLGILGVAWLVVRIRDARTPAWKKKAKKERF